MSGLIGDLTDQTFALLVMFTGPGWNATRIVNNSRIETDVGSGTSGHSIKNKFTFIS